MKKNIKLIFVSSFICFCFLIIMVSCKKDSVTPLAGPGTITAQVSAGTSFTLLKSAVVKAGLATTLDGGGPFTVFAPTDAAFQALLRWNS